MKRALQTDVLLSVFSAYERLIAILISIKIIKTNCNHFFFGTYIKIWIVYDKEPDNRLRTAIAVRV